jgi:hypothetical protein
MKQPTCSCFARDKQEQLELSFHAEHQDPDAPGWKRLLSAVEEAERDGREEFVPFAGVDVEEVAQVVTLPPSIGRLKAIKRLVLYGSYLVRIPREIGEMTSLEFFNPYTSWRLHWLPYEITRCSNLKASCVSTRCLYGNFKYRPPFPSLPVPNDDLAAITDATLRQNPSGSLACSVCDGVCYPGHPQVWISGLVATDVMPLLVNACSQACVDVLPTPHHEYVQVPHTGGLGLTQPPPQW